MMLLEHLSLEWWLLDHVLLSDAMKQGRSGRWQLQRAPLTTVMVTGAEPRLWPQSLEHQANSLFFLYLSFVSV